MIGRTLSHYRIVAPLGSGGMGVVFKAEDLALGRLVALKMLPADSDRPDAIQRLRREARAASSLNHPNICTVHEIGQDGDGPAFIAMELLEGQTLRTTLTGRPLPPARVLDIAIDVTDALEAAHGKGIIHRDIKPSNIFLTTRGPAKVLDFGLARVAVSAASQIDACASSTITEITETGATVGTVAYMSPEQVRGEALDAGSDLFSTGAVLYEMATGRPAFAGATPGLIAEAILNRAPEPPSRVSRATPPALDSIVGRALEKDRRLRYQSAADLRSDLMRLKRDMEPTVSAGADLGRKRARTARRYLFAASLAGVVATGIAVGSWMLVTRRSPKLTDKDSILLADFANSTDEPLFDGALRQALEVQLEQSPFLSLVSDQRVQQTLRLMGRPPDTRLTPEVSREVCERTVSAAVLNGSITKLGNQYVLGLKASDCSTGDALAAEQVTADRKEQVLSALGRAATTLRERLGESLMTVQKYNTPIEQATTPSLDALKAYSEGWKLVNGVNYWEAIPGFQRAVDLDPGFAMAYASLGAAYAATREQALSADNATKAYALRDRVSDRERFYIESHYYHHVTGDLEKARAIYELWTRAYPRDADPHENLWRVHTTVGQYDKALAEAGEYIDLAPSNGLAHFVLAFAYVNLGRFKEARETVDRAAARGLAPNDMHTLLYFIAFHQNDRAGMAQQVAWSSDGPMYWGFLGYEADTTAYFGHLAEARALSRRAVAGAKGADRMYDAAGWEAAAALREALFGNIVQARERADAALKLSLDPDVTAAAGLTLALVADTAGAQTLVSGMERRYPDNTLVRCHYVPMIKAEISIQRNHLSNAIELLQAAAPCELGSPPTDFPFSLYPVYVRGSAYLRLRQGPSAAAQFQRILDMRAEGNGPILALAPLGLGRAYALQGDLPRARTAYEQFLTLWKDADPDIPVLVSAKAEYEKLH
jgi:serine/threonine protein kinase/tetratricopeptide (TPR) repeat protein